ncbi:MAG: DNA mismatch repair protein MutS [Bryobacteraceae bacterium]|nr:DNA mismatch repair protein MutS [Bryobacteraceae bacterium]
MTESPTTPLMRQYHAVKERVPHALLMFRLGDFYELFYDDAVTAARELEITLTARNKEKGAPVPMCGVPYHAAEGYIARLVEKGYRVALCDQMEAPSPGKKLVRRELTRIVTPGTATEAGLLKAGENNWLAAVVTRGHRSGVAFADISTGEFRATELAAAEAVALIEAAGAREVLRPGQPPVEEWAFDSDYGDRTLREHFRLLTLDGCGLGGRTLAVGAAGAILHYLRETQRAALAHLDRPAWFDRERAMILDPATVRNLELVEPLFAEDKAARAATLLSTIDRTLTGMGARLLRRRLLAPSIDRAEIEERLDAVEAMAGAVVERAAIRKTLAKILDLERLLAKITLGTATARDLLGFGRSLGELAALKGVTDLLADLHEKVSSTISEEPPATLADGGAIRPGRDPALDELRDVQTNAKQYIAAIEQRERQRTGIQSLKVRFNNIFGYYIEISKPNLPLAPADYERKQTLVNAERFTTPELKELEVKILEAQERILAIEKQLFTELCETVAAQADRVKATAAEVAGIDVATALAELAAEKRYVRPRFSEDGSLRIVGGRHPVIEAMAERDAQLFTPNDVYLDSAQYVAIVTGPNMGGKSTYLRQAALVAILAQTGSFVPAAEAHLPIVDRVFTRVGASDNLSRGRSTFMMEMTETALILNSATERSLIVLDEIGRGTSTYDGLAIAWAVLEYIHSNIRAKTLFATHYHELTALSESLPGVRNLRVTVKESGDQIVFLRRVEPGAADKSYGIEVARLAALPVEVIDRAKEILALHERTDRRVSEEAGGGPVQIQLFEPVRGDLASRIRALKLDELRPIEALQLLAELQKELEQ